MVPSPPNEPSPDVRTASSLPLLRVETVTHGDHLLVLLHGEVDLTAQDVLGPLCAQLAARGLPVVLDASHVDFMDCAGLGAVLALVPDGGPSSITAASPQVQLLLDATTRGGRLPGAPTTARPRRRRSARAEVARGGRQR